MGSRDELLRQERGFWDAAGDGEFYQANMADDGLCVLPVGMMDKAATTAAISQSGPWQDYELDDVEVRELGAATAVLTYRARASRADGDDYHAVVSTIYRNDNGRWKLLVHQQTPLHSGGQ